MDTLYYYNKCTGNFVRGSVNCLNFQIQSKSRHWHYFFQLRLFPDGYNLQVSLRREVVMTKLLAWQHNIHYIKLIRWFSFVVRVTMMTHLVMNAFQFSSMIIISHHAVPNMMASSNGNIFRVTWPLCGELTGHRWVPAQRPVTQSFCVFFDLGLNKRLSKQWRD